MLSVFLITSTLILESSMKTEVLEEPGYLVESDLDSKEESRGKIVIDFSCFPFLFSQFLQLSEITLNLFRTLRNWNETRNNEPHISYLLRGEKRKWILALPELTPSFLSLPSAPWRNSMDTSSFSSSHCMTKGSNHLGKKINMSPPRTSVVMNSCIAPYEGDSGSATSLSFDPLWRVIHHQMCLPHLESLFVLLRCLKYASFPKPTGQVPPI